MVRARKFVLLLTAGCLLALWPAASGAQALAELPGPLEARQVTLHGPGKQVFRYADCVEVTLLRLLQAFTRGHLAAFLPDTDLLAFAQANHLEDARPAAFYESRTGMRLRSRWAQFLAHRPDFVYRTPLDAEMRTYEVKAMWTNIYAFFWRFFPALRDKLDGDSGSQLAAICAYFGDDFRCNLVREVFPDPDPTLIKRVSEVSIDYRGNPYLRWVIWEKFQDDERLAGDMYLEDLRQSPSVRVPTRAQACGGW